MAAEAAAAEAAAVASSLRPADEEELVTSVTLEDIAVSVVVVDRTSAADPLAVAEAVDEAVAAAESFPSPLPSMVKEDGKTFVLRPGKAKTSQQQQQQQQQQPEQQQQQQWQQASNKLEGEER
jgi:hypothetical protein